jgi:hypothetical protein
MLTPLKNLSISASLLILTSCEIPQPRPRQPAPPIGMLSLEFLGESYYDPIFTELGIPVYLYKYEYKIDMDFIDDIYLLMCDCAQLNPDDYIGTFNIVIYNNCSHVSTDKRTLGLHQRSSRTIAVTSNLYALAHEIGHHLMFEEDLYTDECYPDSGHPNALETSCGNMIDEPYLQGIQYDDFCDHLF